MGQQVSKEQQEELEIMFRRLQLDTGDEEATVGSFKKFCRANRNGLSQKHFKLFLMQMNKQHYNDAMVRTVFHMLDTNGDGVLDLIEFSRYFILLSGCSFHTKIQLIFEVIDRDSSGTIDKQEFINYYCDLIECRAQLLRCATKMEELPHGDFKELFSSIDTDKNDLIDMDEFKTFMMEHGKIFMKMLDVHVEFNETEDPTVPVA